MGKAVTSAGGTGNTLVNNKWDETSGGGGGADGTVYDDTAIIQRLNGIDDELQSKLPSHGGRLSGYREPYQVLTGTSSVSIPTTATTMFTHTPSNNGAYIIDTDFLVDGESAYSFTLFITQPATAYAMTFPASVKWQGGEVPDMSTANKTYILTFTSVNMGVTWFGMFGGEF